MSMQVAKGVAQAKITAVIRRADGRIEHLDLAYWHSNPLRRAAYRLKKFFRRG